MVLQNKNVSTTLKYIIIFVKFNPNENNVFTIRGSIQVVLLKGRGKLKPDTIFRDRALSPVLGCVLQVNYNTTLALVVLVLLFYDWLGWQLSKTSYLRRYRATSPSSSEKRKNCKKKLIRGSRKLNYVLQTLFFL